MTYTTYVLKKRNRLLRGNGAKEIFSGRGKTFSTSLFSLKTAELRERSGPLFSVVIPSSLVKLATKRNTLKRRARAIIRNLMKDIKPGTANIVFFKKRSEGLNFRVLKNEILTLLKKGGLLA